MSNLGAYQIATTWAKKVGGMENLAFILLGAGYAAGKIIEIPVRAIVRRIRTKKESNQSRELIEVTSTGTDSSGLVLSEGDSYLVLYSDEDMVLVEKVGDTNNPYMVSPEFLRSVSNYH